MGSKSDMPKMLKAGEALEEKGISYEVRVMSAHRDPETVAEYCKHARSRGLRVIIAGAGLSAALPGVAAAHTDLPVIGVPIAAGTLGGLDALLASVADATRRAGRRRRHRQRQERGPACGAHHQLLISRYTREEIGAVWTQQRKLDAWLEVELAATDAWSDEGTVPADGCRGVPRARRASRSKRSPSVSGRPTTTSRLSSTSLPARSARPGAGSTTA